MHVPNMKPSGQEELHDGFGFRVGGFRFIRDLPLWHRLFDEEETLVDSAEKALMLISHHPVGARALSFSVSLSL